MVASVKKALCLDELLPSIKSCLQGICARVAWVEHSCKDKVYQRSWKKSAITLQGVRRLFVSHISKAHTQTKQDCWLSAADAPLCSGAAASSLITGQVSFLESFRAFLAVLMPSLHGTLGPQQKGSNEAEHTQNAPS